MSAVSKELAETPVTRMRKSYVDRHANLKTGRTGLPLLRDVLIGAKRVSEGKPGISSATTSSELAPIAEDGGPDSPTSAVTATEVKLAVPQARVRKMVVEVKQEQHEDPIVEEEEKNRLIEALLTSFRTEPEIFLEHTAVVMSFHLPLIQEVCRRFHEELFSENSSTTNEFRAKFGENLRHQSQLVHRLCRRTLCK